MSLNRLEIPFLDALHIADVSARVLAEERPARQLKGEYATPVHIRSFCRASAVGALRFLWRTGDPDTRATVCARVHVWLHQDFARLEATQKRILTRERARQQPR